MNLLDIFEGREPHQQAIDRLEQARIDHLKEKMDYYSKHHMVKDFQKAKAEHDSYFKVQDECMGYGTLVGEAANPAQQAAIAKKKEQGVAEGMFGSRPSPVLPIVDKINKVARGLTPQNVEVGKQIIQANARDITRMLSSQDKAGVDVIEQGVAEGGYNDYDNNREGFGRDENLRNRERNAGLETEQNNIQISINGRPWKVVPGRGYADSREEREYFNNMRRWAEKKSATSGKKWTVSLTGANPTVNELSTEKLAQYKKAAGADAKAADKAGNIERGDKRFSGIVKATKKQFANDLKKHGQQGVEEAGILRFLQTEHPKVRKTTPLSVMRQEFEKEKPTPVPNVIQNKDANEKNAREIHRKYAYESVAEGSSNAVERAILNRIMVAHTDLLMKFGPDKVMQAAEEVAYDVGDVDEIGTSDVSAYVNQVRRILGAE